MRGLGKFQLGQKKKGDPRVPQLFQVVRQALGLLEEIILHPHEDLPPAPPPAPDTTPVTVALEKLAYSIKEVRTLTGMSNAKIYKDIQKGRLRSSKNGGRTLILPRTGLI